MFENYVDFQKLKLFDLSDLRVRPRIPHELLFVVGGWSNGSPINTIEIYDPRADVWQFFHYSDHISRAYHGSVLIKNFIYLIGGTG